MSSVLIVDDDASVRHTVARTFAAGGHEPLEARTGEEALALGIRRRPRAAVVDLVLPGLGGQGVVAALCAELPGLVAVCISGRIEAVEAARLARRAGAVGYFQKPCNLFDLMAFVERHLAREPPTHPPTRLIPTPSAEAGRAGGVSDDTCSLRPPEMLGESPAMRALYREIARVARGTMQVLVEGPTGSGKELVARSIHAASGRGGSLVAVNCASVPRGLLEAELFGTERGAFTGAVTRPGFVEEARGGTLFLDEIAELPLEAQAVLLRVLDNRLVQRLGGRRSVAVDFRLIAATHIDLRAAVAARAFREDLWYRLTQGRIQVPSLAERGGDDIVALAEARLVVSCALTGSQQKTLGDDARRAVQLYGWPGNVRELHNAIDRAALCASGPVVTATDLPPEVTGVMDRLVLVVPPRPEGMGLIEARGALVAAAEREWLRAAVVRHSTKAAAARALQVNRRTLHEKLVEYGIVLPERDDE